MKASQALQTILDIILQDGDCEIMIAEGGRENVSINSIIQDYDSTLISADEKASRRIIRIIQQ